jgi:hypothetical protein
LSKIHLVIPDSHAHPDYHNERYDWLAELILDIKPDVVVDIGDWFDMPSLCAYDRGTKSFEGRRYNRDIAAGVEAQDRLYSRLRKAKRRLPRFVRTLGNHEHRINKCIERDPILEGTISIKDLQSKEYKWEEHRFLDIVNVDGINYSHYFTSGVMGRPIGGEHAAHTLITKKLSSCTQGHSHLFDYTSKTSADGRKIHGCVVGVYQDYDADFAGPANALWDRGVVVKRNVQNGSYDLEKISLEQLKRAYGNV